MASLGTLASLMQTLTPTMSQYDPLEVQKQRTSNQTNLITLADMKNKQAAEQEFLTAIQHDPVLQQQFFGRSILGGLGQPPPGPAGSPMTQQQVVPGQPPGTPQVVPGGQDLSQFATQGAPQSTLASLGPQPQGQPQAPRNPVLEMAQRDPRAAFLMQQQMEAREGQQFKMQEQRLKMGVAAVEHVGQLAQGVTDQASLDAMRADLVSSGLGKYAAELPQFYSKGAMEPFIAKATSVLESQKLGIQTMSAQADLMKARMSGRVAKTDQYLKALGVAPGQETAADMEKALAWQQRDEIAVSQMHGAGQLKDTSLGVTRVRPSGDVEFIRGPNGEILQPKPSETEQKGATLANSVAAANKLATELEDKGYRPSVWEKGIDKLPLGLGNYLTSGDYQKYRQTVREFASAWLYGVSGAQITEVEWENANQTFFPQPNEDKGAVDLKRQRRAALVEELRQQTQATGRTGTQAQPPAQGPSGGQGRQSTLKPVGEMSRDELLAERDRLRKGGG